jgi:hypothetical protein
MTAISKPAVNIALAGSLIAWFTVSWEALMTPHPNPAVAATLCLRHDVLTTSQAIAFQFPVITAAFLALQQNNGEDVTLHRRLLLGIASMSLWTGSGVYFCKIFSRGYELFSNPTRYTVATVQGMIAFWALTTWKKSIQGTRGSCISRLLRGIVGSAVSLFQSNQETMDSPDLEQENDAALYTATTLGILLLAVMPQLVGFPTATIPTILGKRFSRTSSGIIFLASVLTYCVRDFSIKSSSQDDTLPEAIATLRRGLSVGAIGHLFLVIGKLIGIDGGGLLLPGNGLWEFYPSMVNASRAATSLMIVTFSTLAFVCTGKSNYSKVEAESNNKL